MQIGKEDFSDCRFPHTVFKIFPFQCSCGCRKIAFMENCTRIGNFDYEGGYWEYFILGHYERMVEKSHKQHPEIPICPNCNTHYHVGKCGNQYMCHLCEYEF